MTAALVRYLGVYDADGGLAGELRYVIGHLSGTTACALCDITHSTVRRKPAWDHMVATLGAPFDLRHRNELTAAELYATTAMQLPYVAAELDDGTFVEVLDTAALTACEGDLEQFRARLLAATPSRTGPDTAGLISYDLIIVGAGSGNMLPDDSTADWRVAIVESDRFGGTCLNRGCIPSKMFVYAADVARHAQDGARFGVATSFDGADWPAIRDRVFSRIDPIHDDAVAYRRANGIDVHLGAARFVAPKVLEVDGHRITAERIVIAAGTRPYVPAIAGIDLIEALTSDDVMRIDTLPASMLVLGGGVIAAEMGHVFASLGTDVIWVHRGSELLEGQDHEVRARFSAIAAERYDVRLTTEIERLEPIPAGDGGGAAGGIRAHLRKADGTRDVVDVERLLVATGRIPNSDLLDVAAGGLEIDAHGHLVTEGTFATNVEGVWSFGDAANHFQLKHVANAEARLVRQNLLVPGSAGGDTLPEVPAAVFTDPQIASVGLTEDAARTAGSPYVTAVREYASTAYGWAMEDTTSFVKVLADPATHLLIGAHIMGPQASLLIQPLLQAMAHDTPVERVAQDVMYIHPALSEVVENALLDIIEAFATD